MDLLNSGVSVTLVISALLYYKYGIRLPVRAKKKSEKEVIPEAKTERRRRTNQNQKKEWTR